MNPRSLTPLCRIPRSSSRSTAWQKVACETENAMWCTQPGSVDVRVGSGVRSSLVKIVISRPSPGSKYRWLSDSRSRFGCSKTNGMPSTPSQKSIEVCRSAPTMRDVVDALALELSHVPSARRVSTCTRCAAACPTARARRVSAPRARCAVSRGSTRRARHRPCASGASSTLTGSGGSCLTPAACGRTRMWPLTCGREAADHLADRGGEDVDAADDQHVVGAADAADARAGAAARARASCAPRRGRACGSAAAARRGGAGGSARARRSRRPRSARASPVSGSISSGWTKPWAPRCMPSCCSHSPHSETPMSPMPIASVTRAPQPSSSLARNAGSPPPGSPATSTRSTLEPVEVEPLARGRRRTTASVTTASGSQQLDRLDQPLGVAGADRDVGEAEAVERRERGAGHERPGVVGADDPLAGLDAGRGVAARRAGDPVVEVAAR